MELFSSVKLLQYLFSGGEVFFSEIGTEYDSNLTGCNAPGHAAGAAGAEQPPEVHHHRQHVSGPDQI